VRRSAGANRRVPLTRANAITESGAEESGGTVSTRSGTVAAAPCFNGATCTRGGGEGEKREEEVVVAAGRPTDRLVSFIKKFFITL